MTHLILWVFLALLGGVGVFFGFCEPKSAVIWWVATFVFMALSALFGEEA